MGVPCFEPGRLVGELTGDPTGVLLLEPPSFFPVGFSLGNNSTKPFKTMRIGFESPALFTLFPPRYDIGLILHRGYTVGISFRLIGWLQRSISPFAEFFER